MSIHAVTKTQAEKEGCIPDTLTGFYNTHTEAAENRTRQTGRKKFPVESGADAAPGRIPPVSFLFHMNKERAEAGDSAAQRQIKAHQLLEGTVVEILKRTAFRRVLIKESVPVNADAPAAAASVLWKT